MEMRWEREEEVVDDEMVDVDKSIIRYHKMVDVEMVDFHMIIYYLLF